MKIINLTGDHRIYTSNVYLVTGTWNAIDDVNTLVDVGRDPIAIKRINNASTGVGKKRVEQVVLTHSHFDHTELLPKIRELFNPRVFAFAKSLEYVDCLLKDGDSLKMGDRIFETIHIPGHSCDSVCLYCEQDGVLFAGDQALIGLNVESSYDNNFAKCFEKLCRRNINTIYFGHGNPLSKDCNMRLRMSLKNVRKSRRENKD